MRPAQWAWRPGAGGNASGNVGGSSGRQFWRKRCRRASFDSERTDRKRGANDQQRFSASARTNESTGRPSLCIATRRLPRRTGQRRCGSSCGDAGAEIGRQHLRGAHAGLPESFAGDRRGCRSRYARRRQRQGHAARRATRKILFDDFRAIQQADTDVGLRRGPETWSERHRTPPSQRYRFEITNQATMARAD